MATRMQQRRSPAADWTTANPILAPGEIGFETDTTKFKIGDGTNHWVDLSYFDNVDNIGGSLGDYIPVTQKGSANGVASLDSTGNVPFSQLGNIIDGAPGVLDTLNEIAAAIGDDENFISTITSSLNNKQDKVSGVSDTEIGYLDGVTSSIQTQLNSKLDSSNLAEAAQDAVNSALTAGTGINKTYDDAGNTITISVDTSSIQTRVANVSNTEIGYLDGVTSAIQDQIDSKASTTSVSNHTSATTNVHGISDTSELATKEFAANLLTNATKTNISISGNKNGLTITAENGVADSTTDDLVEGSNNKYFTDERAQDAVGLNVGSGLIYTDSSGEIKVDTSTIATKTYADTAASNAAAAIVDSAPSTLNTLNELATALGNDANYATTITTSLGLKAPLASPALTGTPTAPTASAGNNTTQISTTAFVKTAIDAITTTGVTEGTHLYFTDQRAVDAVVYAINHGLDITLDGGTL